MSRATFYPTAGGDCPRGAPPFRPEGYWATVEWASSLVGAETRRALAAEAEIARSVPVLDDSVTEGSANGVKSSGVWAFAKGLLPDWLTSDYAEPATVASVEVKADKATTLAGYGITDGATKEEVAAKADKATTLAGYGITDGATKEELATKADKDTTLAGYGITDGATKEELAAKADKATTLEGYGIADGATKSELSSKADKSTTLAGYGITDGATKEEVATKADLVDGKVPANQLPSYVDDVLEYDAVSAFPAAGEGGKIYVAKDTNKTYRWSGTQYVEISQSLALGETSETAYPGDKGLALSNKIDAHISKTDNPHAVTAAQVGALPATKKTEEQYAVSPNVSFLSGLKIENREAGVRIPVMFGVVDNETEGVTTFKITIPPDGGFKIDFSNGAVHSFLKPDGSVVLTKNVADALYPAKTEVDAKVGSFKSVGGVTPTVTNGVANLAALFGASNTLLEATVDARLPYPLNAVTAEPGLLKDRAINTTSLASVTVPDNFTDLLIRASVASSLAVTMPTAIATKYGDAFPGEAGEYLITITKTGAAEAYVRTIKLEVANA